VIQIEPGPPLNQGGQRLEGLAVEANDVTTCAERYPQIDADFKHALHIDHDALRVLPRANRSEAAAHEPDIAGSRRSRAVPGSHEHCSSPADSVTVRALTANRACSAEQRNRSTEQIICSFRRANGYRIVGIPIRRSGRLGGIRALKEYANGNDCSE
jgi:hypothetical protein